MNVKKLLLTNLPYLLFVLLGTKCGQAARLAPGSIKDIPSIDPIPPML